MNSCNLFCDAIANINYVWFGIAVVVTFGLGAVWYSTLFSKAWMRVFRVVMPEKITTSSIVRTMLLQFMANVLLGLVFFVLTNVSVWLAVLVLVGFCAWEKGNLNFQFAKIKDFFTAVLIQVGYTFLAGIVFILFAMIGN